MAESDLINTPRLAIVPFSDKFLTGKYVKWLNDPEVVRFSSQSRKVHSLDTCRAYWQSYVGTPNYFWAIVERAHGLGHIGNINAYIDTIDEVADIGILIGNKSAWRRGYAREAWIAVCGYLFERRMVRKITAGTSEPNEAMRALMKATGMVEDGRRVRQTLFEGHAVDIIHAALFRESWKPAVQ